MTMAAVLSPAASKVTFRLAGGAQPLMLVPVRVNEKGPFEFIVDTGAGTTLLTPHLAESLQIKSTGTKQGHTAGGSVQALLATADSLAVGEVREENLDVAIVDLEPIARAVGAKIDGDLGYNFLRHFRLAIDYRALELKLDDPRRVEYFGPPPRTEVPMRLANPAKPLILIDAHVGGRGPFQFAIDTGTSTSAISAELALELGFAGTPVGPVSTGGAPLQMSVARVPSLRVGACEVRDLDVMIGEFLTMLSRAAGSRLDGIIGYNFLRNYRVVIDYPNEVFRFE